MSTSKEFWGDQRVIPVVVINDARKAVELARALVSSGTRKIEITLRTPAALEAISRISAEVPEASRCRYGRRSTICYSRS